MRFEITQTKMLLIVMLFLKVKFIDSLLIINSNSNIVVEPFLRPIIFKDKVIHAIVPVPKHTRMKDLVIYFL